MQRQGNYLGCRVLGHCALQIGCVLLTDPSRIKESCCYLLEFNHRIKVIYMATKVQPTDTTQVFPLFLSVSQHACFVIYVFYVLCWIIPQILWPEVTGSSV